MNNKPFFSVVVPTLNRAKYISFAIQSVLNQTFEDFELIVSDNSSTDNTEQIVRNFSDKRIRYVKTEKTFPMYDSWEFALSHAKGEYITFLGDDDAHSSIYLESSKKVIEEYDAEMVCCRMADYHYKTDSLTAVPFSNELLTYESPQAIKDIFVYYGLSKGDALPNLKIPLLINTVYHNSIFPKIKDKLGRVFPVIFSNDFYLAIIALSFVEKYYYIDSPLSFHGISPESSTTSIASQKKGASLKDTQPELAFFAKVPVNLFVPYNFLVDALLLAKSHVGDSLNYINLDFTGYFVHIYQHIHLLEVDGKDVSEDKEQFFSALSKQEKHTQKEVESIISDRKVVLKNKLRLKFHENNLYRFVKNLHDLIKYERKIAVKGEKGSFSSITECASFVDDDFLKSHQTKTG